MQSRLHDIPPLRFFSPAEAVPLDAVVDRLVPQPDRAPEDRVVVTPFLDQLFEDDTDGFCKDGMPWDQQAWRQALTGIDETSRSRHGPLVRRAGSRAQDDVLSTVQSGDAEREVWREPPAAGAFSKLVQEVVVSVYYAHPAAWAEIGWSGPASKRGYMRTGYGRDPWQPREGAPVSSVPLVEGATSGGSPSGSEGVPRCPEPSPRWGQACPTRSARSSPIRTDRRSPS